uniref:SFRICE_035571 n=1 Tax=Spodoptera frugiperda TaxID=7108 RepID=A0A2H1VIR9_SPOFR
MKSGGGLMAPPGCFPGRYSPTYRSSDPRRCVPNPSVSTLLYTIAFITVPLKSRGRQAFVPLVDVAHSAASRGKHHRSL